MCPSCKSKQIRRSRSQLLRDRVMKFAGMRAYRCRECNRRFYVHLHLDEKLYQERLRSGLNSLV